MQNHTAGEASVEERVTSDTVKRVFGGYIEAVSNFVEADLVESSKRVVDLLDRTRSNGGTIYIAGNGGSASTASHWVNDLGKATKCNGKPAMRVISLNDNVSWLTALANDEGYERVFTGQLENFAKAGDVLIVISASGNSPNLVHVVDFAKSKGVLTVGLLGFDGGVLKTMVDESLWIRTEKGAYGVVEGAHSVLCHALTACLVQA